jgi:hypothetical protein
MFCPGCGYHTAAGQVRFCPGCGFRLDGVTELLAREGEPLGRQPQTPTMLSEREKGIRLGVKVILLSVVLFPIFLGVSVLFDSPGPLLPPVTIFLAGLTWSIYCALFGERNLPVQQAYQIHPGPRELLMPGRHSVPNTGAMPERPAVPQAIPPASVTERTTNLLKDE